MAKHNFRITLKRETLDDPFKAEAEKIYTEFPLKLKTFTEIENFVNKEFKDSEYFILKVDFYAEAYLINLGTFIKVDYDSDINYIVNFDNEIIYKGPVSLQKNF